MRSRILIAHCVLKKVCSMNRAGREIISKQKEQLSEPRPHSHSQLQKYCSCLKQLENDSNTAYNPYAVCRASVRDLEKFGRIVCFPTPRGRMKKIFITPEKESRVIHNTTTPVKNPPRHGYSRSRKPSSKDVSGGV